MKEVDLTKDADKLLCYQSDAIIDELLALELHFSHIYEGRLVSFCISCLDKHLRLVRKLSQECIDGRCHPEDVWKECNEWADDLIDRLKSGDIKLDEGSDEAFELAQKARDFRKKFEEIVASCGIDKRVNNEDYLYD